MTITIDKKSFLLGVLSATAAALLAANLMYPEPAAAAVAIKERDYTAVTGRTTKGGEALYLTDNRTGLLGVFAFDPGKRALQVVAVRAVSDAFTGRGGAEDRNDRNDRRGNRPDRGGRIDR
jgi:predicted hydrolase (HD superfamily)